MTPMQPRALARIASFVDSERVCADIMTQTPWFATYTCTTRLEAFTGWLRECEIKTHSLIGSLDARGCSLLVAVARPVQTHTSYNESCALELDETTFAYTVRQLECSIAHGKLVCRTARLQAPCCLSVPSLQGHPISFVQRVEGQTATFVALRATVEFRRHASTLHVALQGDALLHVFTFENPILAAALEHLNLAWPPYSEHADHSDPSLLLLQLVRQKLCIGQNCV